MLTFRRFTVIFFILLAGLNLIVIFGYGGNECFVCRNLLWLYLVLIAGYLVVSFVYAFFPCSDFHHKVFCRGITDEKIVSLSFDDGPDPDRTAVILDILKEEQVPAIFFLIGEKLKHNETIVKRIVAEGHLVGNHSWSHSYWFDLFSARRMIREFTATNDEVFRITGKKPLMIRPPYGVVNPMVSKAVRKSGRTLIGWSVRSFDTIRKENADIERKVMAALRPGSVILFHDTSSFSTSALAKLIQKIKGAGYTFVLIDKLLNLPAYE